jgi:cation transporter-like permease
MEMPDPLSDDPVELPSRGASRGMNRLLANRQLWKNAIYAIALITYLCSFLFFGLAVADVRGTGGSTASLVDLLVALYFLVQVIFLFVLSSIVERRRQSQPISFPDRRDRD